MTKEEKYRDLVKRVRDSYEIRDTLETLSGTAGLFWVPECEEINLWTYWQGRGNYYPKILLTGQDWGCGYDKLGRLFRENAKKINAGSGTHIFADIEKSGNQWVTDHHLIKLFEKTGYQDIDKKQYSDLFFTNFCLGYRSRKSSGALEKKWLEKDSQFFRELAAILEPEVVLCLGRDTFCGVMKGFGQKPGIGKSYFAFVENGQKNPAKVTLADGHAIWVFALAHPGALGTLNRNRYRDRDGNSVQDDSLERQYADWGRIKKYLSA